MNKTSIEWTHRPGTTGMTWNPIRARLKTGPKEIAHRLVGSFCTRVSPGCTNCYASVINKRFGNGLEYTVPNLENVEFFLSEKILQEPLKTKKPCTIFVGNMFDLFHEAIPNEMIHALGHVMIHCPQHTFQLLTKRAGRMQQLVKTAQPNVWLGVSVESQKYTDERIPLLLKTPAAVRFLSVEPQLEAVGIAKYLSTGLIHLVIDGGESGPHARPFNLAWAESLRDQCKSAGVAFFMKQCGSNPIGDGLAFAPTRARTTSQGRGRIFLDPKGGVMDEWPPSLRVREFPDVAPRQAA
jgi:protein gp37